jgi:serine/threonine protein kinase/type II secretory pathway predicted ATPase ExeA
MRAPTVSAPRAEPADLAGLAGQKLGNYRLEQLVGRGRMGVVYRAIDEALLRPTAVKVLSWAVAEAAGQDPVQWFLSEARLVARINHPRVVQIYGVARQGDLCYIAMEYVAGESAEALVARAGPLPADAATDILLQTASALQAAHASGVVHRDVKPGNLLVEPGLVTKLGDFGIALGPPDVRIGNARLRVGTPYYTAPEIWRGEPASPASDIYSLGATYFQLLTGRPPYAGAGSLALEQQHLHSAIPDPRALRPALPASCAALVMRTLAKAAGDRPASAQALIAEGRSVLQELRPTAPAASPVLSDGLRPARLAEEAPPSPPSPPLSERFGFVRRPFHGSGAAPAPYRGEPFASARQALLALLVEERSPAVALTGPHGSGRTALCRGVAAELAPSRLVLSLDLAASGDGLSLLQRLCRAAAVEASGRGALEALAERLGHEQQLHGRPSLLVLDGLPRSLPPASDLAALLAAARGGGAFQILLAGGPGTADAPGSAAAGRVPEVSIPALSPEQIGSYVQAWLRATRRASSPRILFSPDALLLMALRTDGWPGRVDVLAENMLLLGAAGGVRMLASWHAWAASARERWADRPGFTLPERPADWPPPDAVAAMDACRRGVGLPPWPRATP